MGCSLKSKLYIFNESKLANLQFATVIRSKIEENYEQEEGNAQRNGRN